jgi:tetratricopeptide (TPR) repeat protein
MKKLFVIIILGLISNSGFCQDPQKIYMEGVDSMKTGNFESAIKLFKLTTELQPENPYAWYNKGIAEGKLEMDEEALIDFKKTIEVDPTYKKGWLNLATTKKHLTDYDGAFQDYRKALSLDPNYQEAYYNLALMFELFNKKDSACIYFEKAIELGATYATKKIEKCKDKDNVKTNSILYLKETAKDKSYGFTEKDPIMVGVGPDGGPANQRAYMNLLRDKMGKKISYERKGSCCAYESKSGGAFGLGMGMLDRYQITYRNEKNEIEKAIIYISFDDYEEPKILFGFKTIERK